MTADNFLNTFLNYFLGNDKLTEQIILSEAVTLLENENHVLRLDWKSTAEDAEDWFIAKVESLGVDELVAREIFSNYAAEINVDTYCSQLNFALKKYKLTISNLDQGNDEYILLVLPSPDVEPISKLATQAKLGALKAFAALKKKSAPQRSTNKFNPESYKSAAAFFETNYLKEVKDFGAHNAANVNRWTYSGGWSALAAGQALVAAHGINEEVIKHWNYVSYFLEENAARLKECSYWTFGYAMWQPLSVCYLINKEQKILERCDSTPYKKTNKAPRYLFFDKVLMDIFSGKIFSGTEAQKKDLSKWKDMSTLYPLLETVGSKDFLKFEKALSDYLTNCWRAENKPPKDSPYSGPLCPLACALCTFFPEIPQLNDELKMYLDADVIQYRRR